MAGIEVFERIRELAALVDPRDIGDDTIAVFERMAEPDSPIDVVPLIYGYVPYARDGFRPRRIAFAGMPVIAGRPPVGSALGGTGIAVSARSAHPDPALAFAYYVAEGQHQRTVFALSGGQPGHATAWEDAAVNAETHDFYRATRATLEGAWVRPRHDGYMPFQHEAALLINAALTEGLPPARFVAELNERFARSFKRA
jgi:multiple sugar transport system substrate-binding protein